MTYQVLARKWRPRNFGELVGQEHVLKALVNALDNDRLHHAFLFTGTRGVGKTTIARILAKSLNCEQGVGSKPCGECSACQEIDAGRFVDLIEVDAASRTKVDDTRELLDNVQYSPTRGRYKVYLIDEVHMLSNHSFNALLKTLEEPPPHVKFLLATTDPQKLPVTILSRCLQFNLKRLPAQLIRDYLEKVLGQEGLEVEPAAVRLVARAADGSMRDALSLLDQAIAYGGGKLAEAEVREMLGAIEQGHVLELLDALGDGDGERLLAIAAELDTQAPDYAGVLEELTNTLQRLAVMKAVPATAKDWEDREALEGVAGKLSPEDLQLFYQVAITGRRDLPLAPEPRGGFEMTVLRMLAFRPAESLSAPGGGARADARPAASAPRPGTANRAAPEPEQKPRSQTVAEESAPGTAVTDAPPVADEAPPGPWRDPDWGGLVDGLGLTGVAHQLAVNSAYLRREGKTLHLQLGSVHAQLKTERSVDRLQEALTRFYREPLKVQINVGDMAADTPAQKQAQRDEARQASARASIERDPNVRGLQEAFSATVDPASVKPVD